MLATNRISIIRHVPRTATARSRLVFVRSLTLGIRQEDPSRIWERRAPLTPDAVKSLVEEDGVEVLVQPCARRVYPISSYLAVGAKEHPTLAPAHIIMGIKEPPIPSLAPLLTPHDNKRRTHLMFSHTHKGQAYNFPLLRTLLANDGPRVIDYELLTAPPCDGGKRVVGFGHFAGIAGTIEGLIANALDHLSKGVASPFLHLPRPYASLNLAQIHDSLASISSQIKEHGTPKEIGPYVIAVTGTGKVASGVLDTLKHLPVEWVEANRLPSLVSNKETDLRKIYAVHATLPTYLRRTTPSSSAPFSKEHYYKHPGEWESTFATTIAPYATLLLNGVSWGTGFPRLMSNAQLEEYLAMTSPLRRMTIADISCDIKGGLEFVDRSTTIDAPIFRTSSSQGNLQIMSVDILPSELPLDASQHFSKSILPYLRTLIREYESDSASSTSTSTSSGNTASQTERNQSRGDPELRQALNRATVAFNGRLTEKHIWLNDLLKADQEASSSRKAASASSSGGSKGKAAAAAPQGKKKVLLLGSGLVSRPFVDQICTREDVECIVASNMINEANALVAPHSNAKAVHLNVSDTDRLGSLIEEADVVVSLLPPPFHTSIARRCLERRTHLVTASYISPEMRALHVEAKQKNIILLNEIGLDPGLDHCSAISLLHQVSSSSQTPLSFTSFCGGLPAPEHTPPSPPGFQYKFSWSPLGVLRAALNDASFVLNNRTHKISGKRLLQEKFGEIVFGGTNLRLEGIANRDSLPYREEYGLGESVRTIVRGTLRYPGFSKTMQIFKDVGLLDNSHQFAINSWEELLLKSLANVTGTPLRSTDPASLRSVISDLMGPNAEFARRVLSEINLLRESDARSGASVYPLPPRPGPHQQTAIEHFAQLLSAQLGYNTDERDMVVLSHEIISRPKHLGSATATTRDEMVYTSSLMVTGTPSAGQSAMSRTVGLPLAFATQEVLDGRVDGRGVLGGKEVWRAVLGGMASVGIHMRESFSSLSDEQTLTVEGQLMPRCSQL